MNSSVLSLLLGFPGGSAAKESTCNVGYLDWEDFLEKGTATHCSVLARRIPRVVAKSQTQLKSFHFLSAFFMGHLAHSSMTTGKIIAFIRWTFVGKVLSLFLLFNVLSRFVIAFLSRSKHL